MADPAWDVDEARWMDELAQGGSAGQTAFTRLVQVYQAIVLERFQLHVVDRADAKEAAQEFWLALLRNPPSLQGDAPVRHYLSARLSNAIKWHHSNPKRPPAWPSLDEEDKDGNTLASARAEPRSDTVWRDFKECVRAALAAFERKHPRLTRMLLRRHFEEWTVAEVGEEFGMTATQARDALYSARRKFAPEVQPCLPLWPPGGRSA